MKSITRASTTIRSLLAGIFAMTVVSFALPVPPGKLPSSTELESARKFDILRTTYFSIAGNQSDPGDGMKKLRELFPPDTSQSNSFNHISSTTACTAPSILRSQEEKALYTSYCASFIAFAARDSLWPLKKLNLANQSLALLDGASATAPESIEVRALRLAVTHHLPFFFNRSEHATADLRWLKNRIAECKKDKTGDGHYCNIDKRVIALLDFMG